MLGKKIGLFSRLFKSDEKIDEPVKVKIGMPKMRQTMKNGRVVNEVEFVCDYGPDSSELVDDYALQNMLLAGVDLSTFGSLNGSSLADADAASNVFTENV